MLRTQEWLKVEPNSFRPRLALAVIRRCYKAFYSQITKNKFVVAPKGKAFMESMKLKQPIFKIVDMPIAESILGDRFYVKNEEKKIEESTQNKILDNRGSIVEMFEVAT